MTYLVPQISRRPRNPEMERVCKVMQKRLKASESMTLHLSRSPKMRTVLQIVTVMSVQQLNQRKKSWMRQ